MTTIYSSESRQGGVTCICDARLTALLHDMDWGGSEKQALRGSDRACGGSWGMNLRFIFARVEFLTIRQDMLMWSIGSSPIPQTGSEEPSYCVEGKDAGQEAALLEYISNKDNKQLNYVTVPILSLLLLTLPQ